MPEWTRDVLRKRTDEQVEAILGRVQERVAKWRQVFASWQLGTRADTDGECRAVKDHRELTLMLRAEVSALVALLVEKQVFLAREFREQLIVELEHLEAGFEGKFPGFTATDDGIGYDLRLAQETMRQMGFPE